MNICTMRAFVTFLLSLELLLQCVAVSGRAYSFCRLDMKDGLSQNTVNVILQDRKGFMWFGTRDGLNRYDGKSFKIFSNDASAGNCLKNAFITALYEDRDENLWIGTDAGICIYYPELDRFDEFAARTADGIGIDRTVIKIGEGRNGEILISMADSGLFSYDVETGILNGYDFGGSQCSVRDFALSGCGRLWVSSYGGLWYTDGALEQMKRYCTPDDGIPFRHETISRILLGTRNRLYLASERFGVHELNIVTGDIRTLCLDKTNSNVFVRDIMWYDDSRMWIGSESGIYIYDFTDDSCINLTSNPFDARSLSDNAIYSICKDRSGGVWIGSFFGGINHYFRHSPDFNIYSPTMTEGTLGGRRIRELCAQKDKGKIWVGSEDAGLFCFDILSGRSEHFAPSVRFPNIQGMCIDGNDLWVGTFSYGVKVIDTSTGRIRKEYTAEQRNTIRDNYVFSICRASTGYIYLGTANFLIKYDSRKDVFMRIKELDNNLVCDIMEDSAGNLWVATYSNGLYVYDSMTGVWKHYIHTDEPGGLPINKIISIFEDSHKDIWVTTHGGGLCRFVSGEFENINRADGLPNDVVYHIEEDAGGFFWLTTNRGLVRFDPVLRKVVKIYTSEDGLPEGQFNYNSGHTDEAGNIYLGTTQGLVRFDGNDLKEVHSADSLFITEFLLFGSPMSVGTKGSPLKKNIMFQDSLRLRHDQNAFSFRISQLNYSTSKICGIVYMLEGLETSWQPVPESGYINYSHVPPGHYVFRIKGTDSASEDSGKRLDIVVIPPFYRSRLAYFIYVLVLCVAGCVAYRYLLRRNIRRQQEVLDWFEQNKEKELYNSRINLFTNLTHEIRTPLTLIKGPLDNILSSDMDIDEEMSSELRNVQQNVDRLSELIVQLLDFQKAEKQDLVLNYARTDVVAVLEEVCGRFALFAKQKGFSFRFDSSVPQFCAIVDAEALNKILSNLLSNAIKYGSSNIDVVLDTSDPEMFSIQVKNDGDTLPEDMKEKIFKPFVRYVNPHNRNIPGTGIGLSLSKFLAEQHKGTLTVNTEDCVTVFTLTLPVVQKDVCDENVKDPDSYSGFSEATVQDEDDARNTVLVVEDDLQMRQFLNRLMSKKYNVLIATDGQNALDVLAERHVDLVLSDIMMPVMDGLELCSSIKTNMNYCHVPVVLLTAKSMVQSKIDGIKSGADFYIEKPFSSQYLQAVIDNLISNRVILRKVFTQYPLAELSNLTAISKTDEKFLLNMHETILKNISNPELKMEDVAKMLCMSRSCFYRKIKGLLELSPNEYLRIERLKEAARLLQNGGHSINDISYMVGFNSPSYFAKCFFEHYGVLPKDYLSKQLLRN